MRCANVKTFCVLFLGNELFMLGIGKAESCAVAAFITSASEGLYDASLSTGLDAVAAG